MKVEYVYMLCKKFGFGRFKCGNCGAANMSGLCEWRAVEIV